MCNFAIHNVFTKMRAERIIIADNQQLTALAVKTIISQLVDSETTELLYATNRTELVLLLRERRPTAVVLDYTLFDFNGYEDFVVLTEAVGNCACWLLISEELTPDFLRCVLGRTHNVGVSYKDASVDITREALRSLLGGVRYIATHATEVLLQTDMSDHKQGTDPLTSTEKEILKLIALGRTNKEIAAERCSSVHTINTHRKNIFRKLNVNSAHEATKYAFRAGIVDASEFYI